jgi:hypothetical protein
MNVVASGGIFKQSRDRLTSSLVRDMSRRQWCRRRFRRRFRSLLDEGVRVISLALGPRVNGPVIG